MDVNPEAQQQLEDALVRVYLVDRAGTEANDFAAKVDSRPGVEIIGGTDDIDDALDEISDTSPDVVLVGTDVGSTGVVDVVERITMIFPDATVVVLATSLDRALVNAAVRAGAAGSLDRTASAVDTQVALRAYNRARLGLPVDLSEAEPPAETNTIRVSGALPVFPTSKPRYGEEQGRGMLIGAEEAKPAPAADSKPAVTPTPPAPAPRPAPARPEPAAAASPAGPAPTAPGPTDPAPTPAPRPAVAPAPATPATPAARPAAGTAAPQPRAAASPPVTGKAAAHPAPGSPPPPTPIPGPVAGAPAEAKATTSATKPPADEVAVDPVPAEKPRRRLFGLFGAKPKRDADAKSPTELLDERLADAEPDKEKPQGKEARR